MAVPDSPFLGYKGIVGPVYRIDPSTDTLMLDDAGLPIVLDSSGFYSLEILSMSLINQRAKIKLNPYMSRKKFIQDPNKTSYGGLSIEYIIDNRDRVLDSSGNLLTPGTFDNYFSTSVVKSSGTCEREKAVDLILTFNGNNVFQSNLKINFSTMSSSIITQTQINNALS